jgi:hypothetical protein
MLLRGIILYCSEKKNLSVPSEAQKVQKWDFPPGYPPLKPPFSLFLLAPVRGVGICVYSY